MVGGKHEDMRPWSPEEDALLLDIVKTAGKRWKIIAEQLSDANHSRTTAMVRNRYLRIERGKELTERGISKNRCGRCGEIKRGHVCRATALAAAAPTAERQPAQAKLSLGAPPLTMAFNDGRGHTLNDMNGPPSAMSSLGSSGCLTFSGLGVGPPSLRQQTSMDILLEATDMHRLQAGGETPSATPAQGLETLTQTFKANPFKLPAACRMGPPEAAAPTAAAPKATTQPGSGMSPPP